RGRFSWVAPFWQSGTSRGRGLCWKRCLAMRWADQMALSTVSTEGGWIYNRWWPGNQDEHPGSDHLNGGFTSGPMTSPYEISRAKLRLRSHTDVLPLRSPAFLRDVAADACASSSCRTNPRHQRGRLRGHRGDPFSSGSEQRPERKLAGARPIGPEGTARRLDFPISRTER